jgi:hypothetical protein
MQALARPIQIITTASIELPKCLLANCKLMCVPLGEEFGQQQALSRLGGCRMIKRSKLIKKQVNCEFSSVFCSSSPSDSSKSFPKQRFLWLSDANRSNPLGIKHSKATLSTLLSNYFHLRANLSVLFLLFLIRLCYSWCKLIELVENKSRNQLKCGKRRKEHCFVTCSSNVGQRKPIKRLDVSAGLSIHAPGTKRRNDWSLELGKTVPCAGKRNDQHVNIAAKKNLSPPPPKKKTQHLNSQQAHE